MTEKPAPLFTIFARAPIRICDNGGWTDTWFARYGQIFNIAVAPYAEVQVQVYPRQALPQAVLLEAENYGDHYAVDPGSTQWERHPLLEATLYKVGVPKHLALRVTLFCTAPAGASTGTSAAVTVALAGALAGIQGRRLSPHAAAYLAHEVETQMLGRQCGVQDQLSCAYGGINLITVKDYPQAVVEPLALPKETAWELERRLALVYLGNSHDSSQVHEQVIHELEGQGPESPRLEPLRRTAELSRQAVLSADFAGLGRAMIQNTEAQASLHHALISGEAQLAIDIARQHGALGWKVNGAGGEGGSLTLLCGADAADQRQMLKAITQANPRFQVIPIHLDPYGLQVWRAE